MQNLDSLAAKRAILDYWTLIEFFSPYLLDSILDDKQTYQKIYADEESNASLPWLNASVIHAQDAATPLAKGYFLYLGLFSVEESADRARHVFAKDRSAWKSVNWRHCLSSSTCFARLTLTTHGIPLLGSLTLSTLPWAHGRLLEGDAVSITIEQYWKSVNQLLLCLREEFSAELPVKLMKEPKMHMKYLDSNALIKLTHLLYQWAGYHPQGYPLALIERISGDLNLKAKDPHIKSERDIPILNSFYIQDLESASISLTHSTDKPLDYYLAHKNDNRILLDSLEGRECIVNTVRPEKIPAGRWPESPSYTQSLMQQFAINAAFEWPIFSVNGPPGTGKTSLLREIIAQNIVLRAKALAKFETSNQCFIGRQALNFENDDLIFLSELDSSLIGYEMVVVSSNNAAVQLLSQELPLRSQLAPCYQNASYLESIARKAFGLKDKETWGLISAPLGNMDNCRRFVENVFINLSQNSGEMRIWEWIDEYTGISFAEAKENFISTLKRQEVLSDSLERLAFLHEEVGSQSEPSYCLKERQELIEAQNISDALCIKINELIEQESQIKEHIALLEERERLWQTHRPNSSAHLGINEANTKGWSEQFEAFQNERLALIEELHQCKMLLKEIRKELAEQNHKENDLIEKFLDKSLLFHLYKEEEVALKKRYPTALLPILNEELDHFQSYYQTDEFNAMRSELFIAAITLHEAWLAEVLRSQGGFRGNLMAMANILQGRSPTTADDTRLVWQSLFLLIPVISSTFASFGRLFRHLEPGSLGWLLIDEAGQAIPQSAVGAIWRANKVLSIGDPFQIEPICTVPPEVIDGMAKIRIKDDDLAWAPSQISVQNLMDRGSVFGAKRTIREQSYWLGSPLRVHRRCEEPMFTIANAIAYESSMLLAIPSKNEQALDSSCWWDVTGHASDKQYVPNQGVALLYLLKEVLFKIDDPDIFVISPFREVIAQIKHLMMEDQSVHALFALKFPKVSMQSWLKQAFGTVHTFQGKQAGIVFFVLGADKTTFSAVEWASRKPNLLNVALTRAQFRFYMIGDYDLWKNRPYFQVAAKKLERVFLPNSSAHLGILKNYTQVS